MDKLREIFCVLLGIFIFLSYKKTTWINIAFAVAFLLLSFKPYHILFGIGLGIILIGIQQLFLQHKIVSFSGNFKVKKTLSMGVIIQQGKNNILLYTKEHYNPGDLIFASGNIKKDNGNLNNYFQSMNITNYALKNNIKLVTRSKSLWSMTHNYLTTGGNSFKTIAPLILLGDKSNGSKEIYGMAVKLSIVHLFVISGFHISLLYFIFHWILEKIKFPSFVRIPICLGIILTYIILLGAPISATRALLLTFFTIFNKYFFKKKFSTQQILAFTMTIMCLWKPWSTVSLSFIFTFLATGIIIHINSLDFESKLLKYISIIFGVYISTLFIAVGLNQFIAPLGIFFGIVLTPIFSFTFLFSILFLPFKDILDNFYYCFIMVLKSFNSINILINIPYFNLNKAKIVYFSFTTCFIILDIWNLYLVKKVIL